MQHFKNTATEHFTAIAKIAMHLQLQSAPFQWSFTFTTFTEQNSIGKFKLYPHQQNEVYKALMYLVQSENSEPFTFLKKFTITKYDIDTKRNT